MKIINNDLPHYLFSEPSTWWQLLEYPGLNFVLVTK